MNSKYYKIADITIEVRSDLPITEKTFHPKFTHFETNGPGNENVVVHHHFLNDIDTKSKSTHPVYKKPPWAIYKIENKWLYEWIKPIPPYENYYRKAVANDEHTHFDIYNDDSIKKKYLEGMLTSLTMFPTDQILLGRLLSYKNGCIIHSLGIMHNNNGYLFVGHSGAGKSTMAGIMKKESIVLCDDRNIIRKIDDNFILSGTWSHGDVPDVSSSIAPLNGIFFIEQSKTNQLEMIQDNNRIFKMLLACLIRPLQTAEWWEQSISFLLDLSKKIQCWNLQFDKSGNVLNLINELELKINL